MNSFDEMWIRISKEIDSKSIRVRSRTEKELIRYKYAVKHILIDLWKAHHKHPDAECSINKRSGYYSENDRYRDPQLTYKMTVEQAFNGLLDLDLIRITKEGFYDRVTYKGFLIINFTCIVILVIEYHKIKNFVNIKNLFKPN